MAININGTGSITGLSSISAPGISGVPVGSASAPAFSFTGDTNTGIYSPGADQVAISTNGTGRLFVDSSGRVGIGTSSPDSSLTITKDAAVGINIRSADANFSSLLFGCDTVSGFNFITSSTSGSGTLRPISFRMGASEAFRVDTSGRVGIGTTGPIGILSARAVTNGNLHIRDINTIVSGTGVALDVLNDASTTVQDLALRGATTSFHRAGSESARIDSSGRLLVGTSTSRSNWYNSTGLDDNLQIEGTTHGGSGFSIVRSNNSGGHIELGGHGGTTIGSYTLVSSTANLGSISFQGADGAEFVEAASIACNVDGTPGANDMPGRIVLSTTADGASSPTERMRINNSGGVLINTTTHRDSARLVVDGDGSSVNSVWYAPSTSSYSVLYFRNPNGNTGRIDLSGTTTSYVTTSDYRLKENIEPVTNGIARLQQLKPSRFNFIVDPDKTVDGFIAHEVQEVVPEAISGEKDAVDADGNPVYQGIDQSKLVPLLTAALQEAIGEIESLKARVAALGTP